MRKKILLLLTMTVLALTLVGCAAAFDGAKDLQKDPFETATEYKTRLEKYGFQTIGEITLVDSNYDIATSTFNLQIKLENWVATTLSPTAEYKLKIDPKKAKSLYDKTTSYPLQGKFSANGEKPTVTELQVTSGFSKYKIELPSGANIAK